MIQINDLKVFCIKKMFLDSMKETLDFCRKNYSKKGARDEVMESVPWSSLILRWFHLYFTLSNPHQQITSIPAQTKKCRFSFTIIYTGYTVIHLKYLELKLVSSTKNKGKKGARSLTSPKILCDSIDIKVYSIYKLYYIQYEQCKTLLHVFDIDLIC